MCQTRRGESNLQPKQKGRHVTMQNSNAFNDGSGRKRNQLILHRKVCHELYLGSDRERGIIIIMN